MLTATARPSLKGGLALVLAFQGIWPAWPRSETYEVQVVGQHAYAALGSQGLGVYDVSNPTNSVRVGGYDTRGCAYGVAVAGTTPTWRMAMAGLQVIDVSNPANSSARGRL